MILVTGGAGFIGSHLVERLLSLNYGVRILDDLSSGCRANVPAGAELLVGDVRQEYICHKAVVGCTAVFHLAAMSRSAASVADPDMSVNVMGTQNILQAAHNAGVKRVVYAGSSTYYGSQDGPQWEGMRGHFLNFYGLSKYVGEEMCRIYTSLYSLQCNVLRYFNVYGPRQPESGSYSLVMGTFLKKAALGQPLVIDGDGNQRRDFVHVRDIVEATVQAYTTPYHGATWNVGSGESVSIRALANMISPNQQFGPRRVADAKETLADISRIKRDLGWKPQVTLQEGIEELKKIYGISFHSALHY